MKNLFYILTLLFFNSNLLLATNYYSTVDGGWNFPIWSTESFTSTSNLVALPCDKNGSDSIFINNNILAGTCTEISINSNGGGNVVVIKSGSTLVLPELETDGTLLLLIETGATVIIEGDLSMNGNSQVLIEGSFLVNGDVEMTGNSLVCGTGIAWHAGTRSNQGNSEWCTLLPVKLSNFQANWINNQNEIAIHWATDSELNNAFFTVERSLDGINFEAIAKIMSAGNSNEVRYYEIIDNNPSLATIWSYYRLKQTDIDGNATHSSILSLENPRELNDENLVRVFPNPASDNITVQYTGITEEVDVSVINSLGQLQESQRSTNYQISFETGDWAAGVYFIILDHGLIRHQETIVVR